jgi:hypothetical protein
MNRHHPGQRVIVKLGWCRELGLLKTCNPSMAGLILISEIKRLYKTLYDILITKAYLKKE